MPFCNPYHFVPVSKEIRSSIDSPKGEPLIGERLGHRTFDRYHENTLSGRLFCLLETVGPISLGAWQEKDADGDGSTRIHPFQRDGKPAIPASSLRGCLSAVAEAASNSSLRILDDTGYSRRVSLDDDVLGKVEDYSAMGMIIEKEGKLELLPLAIPTLKKDASERGFLLPGKFRSMFPDTTPKQKAYTHGRLEEEFSSYCSEKRTFYYARLAGSYQMDTNFRVIGSGGKSKSFKTTDILLGRNVDGELFSGHPPEENGDGYVRGILRILHSVQRPDIPDTKKHEIFIPFPEGTEKGKTFPIDDSALDRFYRLAAARKEENKRRGETGEDFLPYALKGSQDLPSRQQPYRLKDGDIVFFTPDHSGERVTKVTISQLWREEIGSEGIRGEPVTAHSSFRKIFGELLPFNKDRETITPAEALFGFVEENEKDSSEKARALASRICIGDGKFLSGPEPPYEEEICLRILSSPKPPCPAFYFRKHELCDSRRGLSPTDCFISKKDLSGGDLASVAPVPQGRKFYFNHVTDENLIKRSCKTRHDDNPKQKSKVKPVKKGCCFAFHIDFDNLSRWELGLLLYSVEPAVDFHHKIGMGKPLGLGTVKIRAGGLFFVDRMGRYTPSGFAKNLGEFSPRYRSAWVNRAIIGELRPSMSGHELLALSGETLPDEDLLALEPLKQEFAKDVIAPVQKALRKIGQPNVSGVRPPVVIVNQTAQDPESETFRWFQSNDSAPEGHRQGLVPLDYGDVLGISRLVEYRVSQTEEKRE